MSQYIELNSTTRDRQTYPNPHKYELLPSQVATWLNSSIISSDRTAMMSSTANVDMAIRVKNVVLPYTDALLESPRIYLDLHTVGMDTGRQILCIDGDHRRAKFVLTLDKVITDSDDASVWLQYKTDMMQVIPFGFKQPIAIEFFDITGTTLVGTDAAYPTEATAAKQTFVTFELSPYQSSHRTDVY